MKASVVEVGMMVDVVVLKRLYKRIACRARNAREARRGTRRGARRRREGKELVELGCVCRHGANGRSGVGLERRELFK